MNEFYRNENRVAVLRSVKLVLDNEKLGSHPKDWNVEACPEDDPGAFYALSLKASDGLDYTAADFYDKGLALSLFDAIGIGISITRVSDAANRLSQAE